MTALLVIGLLTLAPQNPGRPSQPDFSGEWVLVNSKGATEDTAVALTVRQPVVTRNVYGAPMPPAYLELFVDRHLATGVQSERYQLGARSGTVNLAGSPSAGASTRQSVTWVENKLVISKSSQTPDGRFEGSRREEWQFDTEGRLVITLTAERGHQSVVTIGTYRRR